ncbi:unnamed protein product [Ectocarpus sp. 4 AP-2014]
MAESASPLLSAEELEASRGHLETASASVSRLPAGLVKRRLEEALKGIDTEVQSQLWGHLRSNSGGNAGGAEQGGVRAVPAMTATSASGSAAGGEGSSTPSDSATGVVLSKAYRARVTPKSALHASALALHCLLLTEGFVCTGQDDKAGAIKGFAAPVRDVPQEKLVPDRWDADLSAVSFRYRRPDCTGKVYLFKAVAGGGPVQFLLGEKGGEIQSADVDLEPLEQCGPKFFESEDFFETLFSVFRREVLAHGAPPVVAPPPQSARGETVPAPDRNFSPSTSGNPRPAIPGTAAEDDDPLRVGPPRFAGPPGVGPTPFLPGRGGDFGGDLFPSGVGGPAGGGGGGLPGPGGLLGPGHPMFGGGSGAGYMEPRFDPYGPPIPGQQPWGPGVPGRGGGGRGGPAQGGPRGPPGGPDNDHLRPPGGSGDMFF